MASAGRRSLWGWDVPVRRLLAVAVLAPAAWLAWPVRHDVSRRVDPSLVVDVNAAPPEVLLALPRLGPVLVGRIVEGRRERPFVSLGDLDARVRGIGPVTAAALRPHLRFPGPPAEGPGPARTVALRPARRAP
jgi:competence protein ComEA